MELETNDQPLHSRKEPLTPQKLRELTGDPNIDDAKAVNIIASIKKLNSLFFQLSQLDNDRLEDNAKLTLGLPIIHPFTQNKAA